MGKLSSLNGAYGAWRCHRLVEKVLEMFSRSLGDDSDRIPAFSTDGSAARRRQVEGIREATAANPAVGPKATSKNT